MVFPSLSPPNTPRIRAYLTRVAQRKLVLSVSYHKPGYGSSSTAKASDSYLLGPRKAGRSTRPRLNSSLRQKLQVGVPWAISASSKAKCSITASLTNTTNLRQAPLVRFTLKRQGAGMNLTSETTITADDGVASNYKVPLLSLKSIGGVHQGQ